MVFYFTSSDGHMLYMGKDKYENEDLIRYGFPEDVWFHVDNLSSAHVYLRMNRGEKLKELDPALLVECCTLVKANSIEGCKRKEVNVVYTRWQNLEKKASYEAGQVGYKDESRVFKCRVEKTNAIVNALNRTKREEHPNLAELQEERAKEHRREQKALRKKKELEEKNARKQKEEEKRLRSYDTLFEESKMASNADVAATEDASASIAFEDDFMVRQPGRMA
ncbi:unnamed protein product [Ectocarpus sp. 6 AP-2014]|uniref:NFACT RNA-binding domain-containing protein n=1 Tax=Ectocarpus siliculosus TaxID=2880 RepID=D7G6E1_ECTSI|nr:conserved unknown protein [Ectocarpus siliculosus]|eukprot:CBJ27536.1 conserved unknown protein [Ectocarpus siliculosus]